MVIIFAFALFSALHPEVHRLIYHIPSNNNICGDHIWTSNGPYGGCISDITSDGNRVYIGLLMNGVYRLETGMWQPRRTGIEYATVNSLIGVGLDTLFAGLDYGLGQTIDGGFTWNLNPTIPDTCSINSIFRYNNSIFFAGSEYAGIYRSTDAGLNWNIVGGTIGDTVCASCFARDTLNIYLGTLGNGIYLSPDLGLTWVSIPSPHPWVWKIGWISLGLLRGYLYSGTESGLYYRRDSLTQQWHSTTLQTSISDFIMLGDSVFVSTRDGGVWVGAIGDSNFSPRNNGLIYKSVNTIENISDTLLVGTTGGFFYSTNHGLTWQERNQNLNANIVWDIEVNPINNQSIYAVSFGGLYKSIDNGESWSRYGTIPDYPLLTSIAINPQDTANIIIGGLFFIYRTTNNGINWQTSFIGQEAVSDIEFFGNQPTFVYATTKKYFFRSTNNGQDWQVTDSLKGYNDIKIHPFAPETLYIATSDGVFKSNNYGESFYQLNNGLPNQPFSRVNIDGYYPMLIYAGCAFTTLQQPALYRSTNGGFDWSPTLYPEFTVGNTKTLDSLPLYLFVCSADSRVLFSLTAGDTFYNISPNLSANLSTSIEFSPLNHTVYLGNLSGIYSYTDTTKPFLNIVAPDSFSPDGDGIEDKIKFNITAYDTNGIYYWKSLILRDTIICQEFEGFGKPDSIIWDGFDISGILQKNGLYSAKLYCVDGFFNYDSVSKTFYLLKKPMVSKVEYATAQAQGRKITVANLGRIHLVYSTFSPSEIFYTNSIDGIHWQEPLDLSNSRDANSLNPTIVIDNNDRLNVFWEEEINGQLEIVFRRYTGVFWDTVVRLTNTSEFSINPSAVATSNNDLHLVWQERQTPDEIWYRRYNFINGNWTPPINLSNTSGTSRDPFILAHNQLYLFFADNTNTTPQNFEIRYRRYDGNQWLAESVLTANPGNSLSPFAVVDSSNIIHLFWADSTPGNFDIFYKRFTPNLGWSPDTNLTQNPARSMMSTASVDSMSNLYLYYSEGGEIYCKIKDHQLGWLPPINISNSTINSNNPSSSFDCDLVWTEGDTAPFRIIYYKSLVPDTIGPKFSITASDTTYLNDSLFITFVSDEAVQGIPISWLRDTLNDSIQLIVTQTAPLTYSGKGFVSGLEIGQGHIVVTGNDLYGNYGSTDSTIFIDSLDTTPPIFIVSAPDTCLLNDTLNIIFSVNEQLGALPVGWLRDVNLDSIQLTVAETAPLNYSGKVYVSGLAVGQGHLIVRGIDLHNNQGSADSTIFIDSLDTTPPQFIITSPDTEYIGDTILITLEANEPLADTPVIWLKDSFNDSLQFSVYEDSIQHFSARLLISGLAKGSANFRIIGEDLAHNITDTTGTIYIDIRGSLLPRDSCFAFPNPTRKDYIKFMFYLNQNAHLKLEIFTLSGRKVCTFIDKDYDGGKLYEETMAVQNMGSDIYIFRATATAGNDKATVIKKFGVIR